MGEKRKWSYIFQKAEVTMLLVLIVLCTIMAVLSDKFLTVGNIINVFRQSAQIGICAIGMTMIILLGGIDLSVGSVQALAGIAAVYVLNNTGSIFLAIVAGVLVGAVVGVINSLIITKMNIPALICTLGTMSIIRGTALVITDAVSLSVSNKDYMKIGIGRLAGIPIPIIILVILFAIFYFVLNYTVFGRYIYAIGGNKQSAALAGIPVDRIIIIAYTVAGMLTGLAAVVLSARLGSGQPNAGSGFEMTIIAAVIVGGVSLNGGKGSLVGTIIGVVTMYVLDNGMVLLGLSSFWQDIMKGVLIIAAVFVDERRSVQANRALTKAKFSGVEEKQ